VCELNQASSNDSFNRILEKVRACIPENLPVFVVGGAVRDRLSTRPVHDLDLALPGDVFPVARAAANRLNGAYFPMDLEHGTARVIVDMEYQERFYLDFNQMRGDTIEDDLKARDFTINAMAVDIRKVNHLIDPLEGINDLRQKILRVCSESALSSDAVRCVRGVRLAVEFDLLIPNETQELIRQANPKIPSISVERVRDEIFKIFDGRKPATGIRLLEILGCLDYVLPEMAGLKGVTQSPPHYQDVWEHTLSVVDHLQLVLGILGEVYGPERGANLTLGLASGMLGRFREQIHTHLAVQLNQERSLRALLMLATLYHDAAKPETRSLDENGRIRNFEHDIHGAELAARRATSMHLSTDEVERLTRIVHGHMRPLLFVNQPEPASPKAIYRFFRSYQAAGIDICLLSLADTLATYGSALPEKLWIRTLETIRALFSAYWERPDQTITPPPLINGNDLMTAFHLSPGPKVGKLLEEIREAQVEGTVKDRADALEYAARRMNEN
jgi:tRNA nucleotidyltransferase/poly(A) polymerase